MAKRSNASGARQRLDLSFEERLKQLKRRVEFAQSADIPMREITRRMGVAKNFELIERELVEDAAAKKRLGVFT